MPKIITQSYRNRSIRFQKPGSLSLSANSDTPGMFLPGNAKILAWAIFLIYFIENGTLGIIPEKLIFVYRNVRISDFILYGVVIYSFFRAKEYPELFYSKSLVILKILFSYLVLVFIVSAFLYDYNIVEFFFRLKGLWASFLIFPLLLLFKRKGFTYLIKIIFPFAVISNILYILSSITGTAYLPDLLIVQQTLPGGFKIYRVYGGTFFGELFFLGFIYFWIIKKFKPHQLFVVILFILPHILAFGRGAWLFFIFAILAMFLWNSLKNKDFKTVIRQTVLGAILLGGVFYALTKFIPESSSITEAIESRVRQGQEDYVYKEGTIGTRVENAQALVNLWLKTSILFGIGMHPMWVIHPVTEEESIYYWGFSDLVGPGVLAAYGLVGLILVSLTQIFFGIISFKILKRTKVKDIFTFLVIIFFCRIIFVSLTYSILIFGLRGPSYALSIFIAVVVYKYQNLK